MTTSRSHKKVVADVTIVPSPGSIPSVSKKLRYADMSVAEGGVARSTLITNAAWVQVFSYTGTGVMLSAVINVEDKSKWLVRLVVDGEEVFGSGGMLTGDLVDNAAYDLDDGGSPLSPNEGNIGVSLEEHDRFVWTCPNSFPVRFESSVKWYLMRSPAQASKRVFAGLFVLTKE